jgi:UTP--glucose-1-phosphate uridylyltransferase
VSVLDRLGPEVRRVLDRFGFDRERFEALRRRVVDGTLSAETNVVEGTVTPPRKEDLTRLPAPDTAAWASARDAGLDAIESGRVGQIVLAGGMATRFGGLVKGAVEALDGRSFLEWKLAETEKLAHRLGARIPVAVMTSFATDGETRAHVAERKLPEPLWFSQFVSLRLTPDGRLFEEGDGSPSLYGPGHGDLLDALRTSGALARLRDAGVTVVCVSNVDNLGARVDPVVVGAHMLAGRPVTTEVATKEGDMGGAPARVDGRMMLLEAMRFPAGFDHESIPVFNTNTALIDLDALERPYDLTWLYVEKTVDGRGAVQLERLYHEITAFVPTTYLVVPRSGPRGRFFPIKVPADLDASRDGLREMLATSVVD